MGYKLIYRYFFFTDQRTATSVPRRIPRGAPSHWYTTLAHHTSLPHCRPIGIMAADGATVEYAEAMNEAIDAANTAEEARDLAVRERDLARAELARDRQRRAGDLWPGGGDDNADADADDAADAAADRTERLRDNGCIDSMVITVFVLFILCWCFLSAEANNLLLLTLVLIASIFWCVGMC